MRILCLVLALAPSLARADSLMTDLSKRYIDGLFRAKPHLATFMGDHRFDDRLPDYSTRALKAREKELVKLDAELTSFRNAVKPSLDDSIDADIMQDGIGLELLYLREIRDWEWDPRLNDSFPYYDPREIVAGRLSDIIHGDFASETDRRNSVTKQLDAMPIFLEDVKAALAAKHLGKRGVPKEYLDQSIKGNKGRIEFFDGELKEFTSKDEKAEAARGRAVSALQRYQTFLEALKPSSDKGAWRLGAALYSKKFPLALQTNLTPTLAIPRAEASFQKARAELVEVATRIYQQLWPKTPVAGLAAKDIINKVKDELSKDHANPSELVQAHAKNLDALRAFIEKHDLVALPPRETLTVEPMPAFKRGSSAAEYLAPGVLEHREKWHATYYVDPIDPTWPIDRVESYLRGQNNYEVQLVAAHEAYPGHHTQYAYSKRNLNPLRAVLWNAPMVEGWAVYSEGLMVQNGWPNSKRDAMNDRYRFYDLRGQMVVATNILLDIKLQSDQMSDEEAVRFMVEEGFQERAMAEKKLLRAKLDSTQLAQYFLGLDEIKTLEADYRKKEKQFNQRAFDDALIGHGSIAVKFLRRYLLGE